MSLITEEQPKAAAPAEQPKFRFGTASSALAVIQGRVKELRYQNEQDQMVFDAFDRMPPHDPKDLAADGEEWRTNVDFGDTEAAILEKVEQINNLLTQPFPFLDFSIKKDASLGVADSLNIVALEHHAFIRNHQVFIEEVQNAAFHMVGTGIGLLHFHTPMSWYFASVPRSNFVYPKNAKKNMKLWPWCAIKTDMPITDLINKLSDPESATAVGWDIPQIKEVIKGLKFEGSGVEGLGADFNSETWVQGLCANAFRVAALNNESIPAYTLYTKEYNGKISEQIVLYKAPETMPTSTTTTGFLYRSKQEYGSFEEFLCPFYLSVGSSYLEKIRGLGHRILPHTALINDLNGRAVDVTILSGSLMLKGKDVDDLEKGQRQLRLGSVVTMIPEDISLDQKSFSNPAAGLVQLENNIRMRQNANSRVFGGSDRTGQESQLTATHAKMKYSEAVRGSGFEADRFYLSANQFHNTLWDRLIYIAQHKGEVPPVEGLEEAEEFWEGCYEQGVQKGDLAVIRRVSANTLFGDGDPNNVFLALQDLGGLMPTLPVSAQKSATRMMIAARTRKPELAERWLPSMANQSDRDLSFQNWRMAQEESCFENSDIPVPVQDDDITTLHVISHTKYAQGVVQSFNQQVLPPDEALKRIFRCKSHNDVHMQRLALDQRNEQIFAGVSKAWQGITNMMTRMQQQTQEAKMAEQQRQLEELKNPRLTVQEQQSAMTGDLQRQIMLADADTKRKIMEDDARNERDLKAKRILTEQQLAAISATKTIAADAEPVETPTPA